MCLRRTHACGILVHLFAIHTYDTKHTRFLCMRHPRSLFRRPHTHPQKICMNSSFSGSFFKNSSFPSFVLLAFSTPSENHSIIKTQSEHFLNPLPLKGGKNVRPSSQAPPSTDSPSSQLSPTVSERHVVGGSLTTVDRQKSTYPYIIDLQICRFYVCPSGIHTVLFVSYTVESFLKDFPANWGAGFSCRLAISRTT